MYRRETSWKQPCDSHVSDDSRRPRLCYWYADFIFLSLLLSFFLHSGSPGHGYFNWTMDATNVVRSDSRERSPSAWQLSLKGQSARVKIGEKKKKKQWIKKERLARGEFAIVFQLESPRGIPLVGISRWERMACAHSCLMGCGKNIVFRKSNPKVHGRTTGLCT